MHTTFWSGSTFNVVERYGAMYKYIIDSMLSYSSIAELHIYNASPLSLPSPYTQPPASSYFAQPPAPQHRAPALPPVSAPLPFSQYSTRNPNRPAPYPQPSRHRNKFIDVKTPLMPCGIPAWQDAAVSAPAAGLAPQSATPCNGLPGGYVLPEANMIVSPVHEDVRAGGMRVLVRIWDLLIYRLTIGKLTILRAKQWHSVMTLETHKVSNDTKTAKVRNGVEGILNECLETGRYEVCLSLCSL